MTPQQQHIYRYIGKFGYAHPAKLIGQIYEGKKFPAELSKRCRELRAMGLLESERDGKYEKFFLPPRPRGINIAAGNRTLQGRLI